MLVVDVGSNSSFGTLNLDAPMDLIKGLMVSIRWYLGPLKG